MSAFETISYKEIDSVAIITLNRPDKLNAVNDTMLNELLSCLSEVKRAEQIKSLIITGAGTKAFCIGSDVQFLGEAFSTRNFKKFRDYLHKINELFFAIEALPIPTIAMIQGKARAGGFEMALACDFVIIGDTVKFGDVHTPFGHITGGCCQRLSRKIGSQKAMDLIMSGRWITGKEAVLSGIALFSAPEDELFDFTLNYAKENYGDKNRECLRFVKENILNGAHLPLKDAVQMEIHNYLEFLATSIEPADTYFKNQEERNNRKQAKSE